MSFNTRIVYAHIVQGNFTKNGTEYRVLLRRYKMAIDLGFIDDDEMKAQIQEQVQATLEETRVQLAKEHEDSVLGLKKNQEELKGEKLKAQEALKAYEGVDLEEYTRIQEAMKDENRKALMQEGKLEELILAATSDLKTEHEAVVAELTERVDTYTNGYNDYKGRYESKTRDDALRDLLIKAGVQQTAIPDALMLGATVFAVGEEGKVESRDRDGVLRKTDDGKILDIHNWIIDCKATRPHWWGQSVSADLSPEGRKYNNDSMERMAKTSPEKHIAARRRALAQKK